ncbi:MAG TPA: type VI secretion system baseplate subunit TssF [Aliidongia sp.]|nr:type VI secretion system baseplate subunit TssF [Aliidongia sp.]
MDPRLLRFYNEELGFIREMGAEFAAAYPKVASRLGMDSIEVADPYIERLIEGFAFLTARIQLKLDAEFPTFTQHLLEIAYPHYLAPTPSMAIVECRPDPQAKLEKGYLVPRDTTLVGAMAKDAITACEFRTAQDVRLWPMRLAEVEYLSVSSQVTALGLNDQRGAKAALRLRLATTGAMPFEKLALADLPLHIRGAGGVGSTLLEQLLIDCAGIVARPTVRPIGWQEFIPASNLAHMGFANDEAMLPSGPRSFSGYRVLQEYFAFPERQMFVRLSGLGNAVRRCGGTELDLIILLKRSNRLLERSVTPENFVLYATPAINLFPRRADRIHLSDKTFEYHIVPDRTRPLDLEIHSVLDVKGEGEGDAEPRPFLPFYSGTDFGHAGTGAAYYTLRRETRLPSSRQRLVGPRSAYLGGEVFVSLVDRNEAPFSTNLRQLAIRCLCTNRDLPLLMPIGKGATDFTLEIGAPVEAIKCIAGPTRPRPSNARAGTAWRLISHLSLNYLSLTDSKDGRGAEGLRELLELYVDLAEVTQARQIEGLKSVTSTSIVRRLPGAGQTAIARGVEIAVTLDEGNFEGTGIIGLGLALNQFFAKYVSINSFTETVIRSQQRGEVMRWPMMVGRRPVS